MMKNLILFIGSLAFSFGCLAQTATIQGESPDRIAYANTASVMGEALPSGAGSSYLFFQTFEGGGYANAETWNVGYGTPDPDSVSSPGPLVDSQSLELDFLENVYLDFPAQSEVWVMFVIHQVTGRNNVSFSLEDSSSNIHCGFKILSDRFTAQHGSASQSQLGVTPASQTHVVWIHYVAESGGGGNGALDIYVNVNSTSQTRPAASISISTGDGSAVSRVRLSGLSDPGSTFYDQVVGSSSEIGDSPAL